MKVLETSEVGVIADELGPVLDRHHREVRVGRQVPCGTTNTTPQDHRCSSGQRRVFASLRRRGIDRGLRGQQLGPDRALFLEGRGFGAALAAEDHGVSAARRVPRPGADAGVARVPVFAKAIQASIMFRES